MTPAPRERSDIGDRHLKSSGRIEPSKLDLPLSCLEHEVVGVARLQVKLELHAQTGEVQADRLNRLAGSVSGVLHGEGIDAETTDRSEGGVAILGSQHLSECCPMPDWMSCTGGSAPLVVRILRRSLGIVRWLCPSSRPPTAAPIKVDHRSATRRLFRSREHLRVEIVEPGRQRQVGRRLR